MQIDCIGCKCSKSFQCQYKRTADAVHNKSDSLGWLNLFSLSSMLCSMIQNQRRLDHFRCGLSQTSFITSITAQARRQPVFGVSCNLYTAVVAFRYEVKLRPGSRAERRWTVCGLRRREMSEGTELISIKNHVLPKTRCTFGIAVYIRRYRKGIKNKSTEIWTFAEAGHGRNPFWHISFVI